MAVIWRGQRSAFCSTYSEAPGSSERFYLWGSWRRSQSNVAKSWCLDAHICIQFFASMYVCQRPYIRWLDVQKKAQTRHASSNPRMTSTNVQNFGYTKKSSRSIQYPERKVVLVRPMRSMVLMTCVSLPQLPLLRDLCEDALEIPLLISTWNRADWFMVYVFR